MDALKKEIEVIKIAFKVLGKDEYIPPGYKEMMGHMIWDLKMEDFCRKAQYVADGHKVTKPEVALTYSSVVSRETVRIALTFAA